MTKPDFRFSFFKGWRLAALELDLKGAFGIRNQKTSTQVNMSIIKVHVYIGQLILKALDEAEKGGELPCCNLGPRFGLWHH